MQSPRFVTHGEASILVLDYAGAGALQLPALLEESERVIQGQPPRSLLLLTRMHGCEFSSGANTLLLEHIDKNRPYAIASAVVGLGHLAAVVPVANRLAGRNLRAFDDEDEALQWLAANKRRENAAEIDAVRFTERDGCRILRIDFRDSLEAELLSRVNVAARLIQSQPERSVLTLTFVEGVSYNRSVTAAIKEYVRENRPYVVAGAVVGLDYLKQIILPLNRLTGRNLRAFDDEDTAATWLVAEWTRFRHR